MKKSIVFVLILLLLVQLISVSALSANDAKRTWQDKQEVTKEKQTIHQDAKLTFAGDNSEENRQAVVDTGKEVLHAALDEAEAWLDWKKLEAVEEDRISDDLRDTILDDVQTNLDKIPSLRTEVDAVQNQGQLGLMTLKMIGKYVELLTDVARDSGKTWVFIGNAQSDKVAEFEEKLRAAADDNTEVIALLDSAKSELDIARRNLENAEDTYAQVVIGGTPFIKFGEANNYIRAARINLVNAHAKLNQAYIKLTR